MSGGKKDEGDLVFNDDFDKGPEIPPPPPPPAPPAAQMPVSTPPPAPPPATVNLVPDVEEDAVVPAVAPEKQKDASARVEPGEDVVLDFTDSTAAAVTTGNIQPAGDTPEAPQDVETGEQPVGRFGWLSFKRFLQYFNVDDKEVAKRVLGAMKGPFKPTFVEDSRENPDLYGPFWIATTLVFLTVVSSNTGSYTDHTQSDKKDEDWDGDYSMIAKAAMLYYIYLIGVGLLLFFILRAYTSPMTLVHVWCIYGYSFAPLLPALLAMVLIQLIHDDSLSDWLTILVSFIAVLFSGLFLIMNFRTEFVDVTGKSVVLIGILIVQLLLGCLLAFYFH